MGRLTFAAVDRRNAGCRRATRPIGHDLKGERVGAVQDDGLGCRCVCPPSQEANGQDQTDAPQISSHRGQRWIHCHYHEFSGYTRDRAYKDERCGVTYG